jgi:perosamine synthetase
MRHYRERFGHREGEFPVAERVSERSLALPFFTSMGEAEAERVCEALAAALGLRSPA